MRQARVDNLKGLLILTVVVGHALFPLIGSLPEARLAYVFIYSFHMPVFAALSGYVSTPELTSRRLRGIVSRLIIPYLLLQVVYWLYMRTLGTDPFRLDLASPYWLLWYLVALATWRVVLPLMLELRFPLAVATGVGVLAGTVPAIGDLFSASRTLVFFPFFLAGYLFANHGAEPEFRPRHAVAARLGLLGVLAWAVWFIRADYPPVFFAGDRSFEAMGMTNVAGGLLRGAQYMVAAVGGLALWRLTPAASNVFTKLGINSLGIYVLHGLVIKSPLVTVLASRVHTGVELTAYVVGACLLAILLASHAGRRIANTLSGAGWAKELVRGPDSATPITGSVA